MVVLGKYNTLEVVKRVEFGLYLDGGKDGEILLPRRYVPEDCEVGDKLDVFIYTDSEDRLIATTERPFAQVGEFAYLEAQATTQVGAFLNWGLSKDLFVPFREQKNKMREGDFYVVYIYVDDETDRIVASSKLDKFLDNLKPEYEVNEEVNIIIEQYTDLGYKVIINNLHRGMIYHNEIFSDVEIGDRKKGYIKYIREDEKIDVSLQPLGYEKIDGLAQQIWEELKNNNGCLPVGDKSSSELITQYFSCSKKNFKKAIGALYKQKKIVIFPDEIKLTDQK